jgi:hypothetical protein
MPFAGIFYISAIRSSKLIGSSIQSIIVLDTQLCCGETAMKEGQSSN